MVGEETVRMNSGDHINDLDQQSVGRGAINQSNIITERNGCNNNK